ncbi:MAG: chondroitinase-B domain-containing protein, partial [Opitutaceae bacterium]
MQTKLRVAGLSVILAGSVYGQPVAEKTPVTPEAASASGIAKSSERAQDLPRVVHTVDSIEDLKAKIAMAAPGETIVLKNGIYTTSAAIDIACRGTADQPVVIRAESVGEAEIAGTHGFKASAPAEHVVISGFKFTHAADKAGIADGTSHVRFTRNVFLCTGEGHYLSVAGDDAQIDYNEFGPKKSPGVMIAVSGTGSQVARRLWMHHNYFHDFETDGSNGAEMIRFGLLSSHRLSNGAGVVEHNLFARCRGVSDMISNRCSGMTYRYN